MTALTFNNTELHPIHQGNQIWLTSSELADALGYKNSKSVTNLYNSNADEFTSKMTLVIESVTKGFGNGDSKKPVRIFSLRGCHLIAMFARTKIAKDFRRWVLDILDREVKTTSVQRTPLRQACDRLAVGNMLISDAYKMVSEHFNVEHIDQIPEARLHEAVAFAYELTLKLKSNNMNSAGVPIEVRINANALVVHMYYIHSWFKAIKSPLAMLSPALVSEVHGHMVDGVFSASLINAQLKLGFNNEKSNAEQWSIGKY